MVIFILSVILSCMAFWYVFTVRLNSLVSIGPLYIIARDNASLTSPMLSIGFMRQTSPPWKNGRGIQVRFRTYSIQIGLCKKSHNKDEQSGLLDAMGGRLLDLNGREIGKW